LTAANKNDGDFEENWFYSVNAQKIQQRALWFGGEGGVQKLTPVV